MPTAHPVDRTGHDTAAITDAAAVAHGAETLATPGSRSAALCAQPRRRTSARVRSVNFGRRQHGLLVCVAEGQQTLAPVPAVIGSRALSARYREARQGVPMRDADPAGALASVQLHALACDLPQRGNTAAPAASSDR